MADKSNGYEEHAATFLRWRHPHIGQSMVREWAREFAPGAVVLELGCGDGVISEALVETGLTLYAMDASLTLLRAFRERFPQRTDGMRRGGGVELFRSHLRRSDCCGADLPAAGGCAANRALQSCKCVEAGRQVSVHSAAPGV